MIITMTPPRVAAELGMSPPTVGRLVELGLIRGVTRSITGRLTLPSDAAQQIIAIYQQQERAA
jgi:hypothetical protein